MCACGCERGCGCGYGCTSQQLNSFMNCPLFNAKSVDVGVGGIV